MISFSVILLENEKRNERVSCVENVCNEKEEQSKGVSKRKGVFDSFLCLSDDYFRVRKKSRHNGVNILKD